MYDTYIPFAPGRALFTLVRRFGRDPAAAGPRLGHVLVVQAWEGGEALSVAEVADRLAVEHSTASRLVAAAEAAGLVRRRPSPEDRRRARLQITAAGRRLRAAAHRHQDEVFARATASWSGRDRDRFAALLVRFADDLDDTCRRPPGPDRQSR
jgi:DNA-binding MarR family transcriptional regulator